MSVGPLGNIAGAAATPLAQAKGTEVERTQEEIGAQRRTAYHARKAEAAAGVSEPDGEDHETHERDADGRRPWQEPEQAEEYAHPPAERQSKDPTMQCGNLLDLTG